MHRCSESVGALAAARQGTGDGGVEFGGTHK